MIKLFPDQKSSQSQQQQQQQQHQQQRIPALLVPESSTDTTTTGEYDDSVFRHLALTSPKSTTATSTNSFSTTLNRKPSMVSVLHHSPPQGPLYTKDPKTSSRSIASSPAARSSSPQQQRTSPLLSSSSPLPPRTSSPVKVNPHPGLTHDMIQQLSLLNFSTVGETGIDFLKQLVLELEDQKRSGEGSGVSPSRHRKEDSHDSITMHLGEPRGDSPVLLGERPQAPTVKMFSSGGGSSSSGGDSPTPPNKQNSPKFHFMKERATATTLPPPLCIPTLLQNESPSTTTTTNVMTSHVKLGKAKQPFISPNRPSAFRPPS